MSEYMCIACSGSGIGQSGDTNSTCYECNGTGASMTTNQHDELKRILKRLRNQDAEDGLLFSDDQHVEAAAIAIAAYINREIVKARIDELEKSKRLIGDLHMERIGVPDIDTQTQIREEERRFWHSTLESRLIELNKGYDVK